MNIIVIRKKRIAIKYCQIDPKIIDKKIPLWNCEICTKFRDMQVSYSCHTLVQPLYNPCTTLVQPLSYSLIP